VHTRAGGAAKQGNEFGDGSKVAELYAPSGTLLATLSDEVCHERSSLCIVLLALKQSTACNASVSVEDWRTNRLPLLCLSNLLADSDWENSNPGLF